MRVGIKILESNTQIQKSVMVAMLPECVTLMRSIISSLKNSIPPIIAQSIYNSPEYQSLVSGTLRLEFGIPDANTKISELIEFWINGMQFIYKPPVISGSKIKSSFSISMIKIDFSDVLGSDAAYVRDNIRGYSLPWLEWLVFDGSKVIVPGYDVVIGPNSRSRTGFALMRISNNDWRVPPEFAGTIENNWITRAIDSASADVTAALERSLAS
jgi:hypothetical protein